MLTLSPHNHFMGWQQEEFTASGLLSEDPFACCTPKETDISCQSLGFPCPQDAELDFEPDLLTNLAGGTSAGSSKKLCHNAYERDRRKKLNDLYSSLRSLLPDSDENKKKTKKLSIPVTVSRVLKYIPELQRRVERLLRRKEEIVSALPRAPEGFRSHCVVSATRLGNREVMVQLCLLNRDAMVSLSRVLKVLEREGLHLMSISTCAAQDRFFCSIHLQGREALRKENFCEHLMREIKEQARADSNITTPSMFMH